MSTCSAASASRNKSFATTMTSNSASSSYRVPHVPLSATDKHKNAHADRTLWRKRRSLQKYPALKSRKLRRRRSPYYHNYDGFPSDVSGSGEFSNYMDAKKILDYRCWLYTTNFTDAPVARRPRTTLSHVLTCLFCQPNSQRIFTGVFLQFNLQRHLAVVVIGVVEC
jgi:hypothetical protein